jgi:hypothetical protein
MMIGSNKDHAQLDGSRKANRVPYGDMIAGFQPDSLVRNGGVNRINPLDRKGVDMRKQVPVVRPVQFPVKR